jgi:serine/threonine protein kinase/tetratricopeptide (TPR) repeat protein
MSTGPESVRPTAGKDWSPPEGAIKRFVSAWRQRVRPAIDDYVPADKALRYPSLIELVHTELELRLKDGEAARVEEYLIRYPELASDSGAVLDLIGTEYELRRRGEPELPVDEYVERFPNYRDQLREEMARVTVASPGALRELIGSHREVLPEVPGYEILSVLGRGGMGVVYKARQTRPHRVVALKVIRAGEHAGPEELARFRREAEAAALLQHPHIVHVYEVGEHGGCPYFSLEYVEGGSLDKALDGTPQGAETAARLVEALARATDYAHQRGVIHRDLKPANVLLQPKPKSEREAVPAPADFEFRVSDFKPKVTDFGLAKRLDVEGAQTRTGVVLGTPSYMAPEQAAGLAKEVGPAADVYALGAILYEMLTGRPPFKATTVLETLEQVRSHEPVPPRRLQPKVARDLETVCLKALVKTPAGRYPTAAALADDLGRFLRGEPIRARPVGRIERLGRWCRRNPVVAGLVTALALAIAGGFAAVIWQWQRAERNFDKARSEHEQAEANFLKARDAVDKMLTHVGAVRLSHVPMMEPVRSALLEEALTFYQEFLQERGSDPKMRQETGEAYRRVGDIHRFLGQRDRSGAAYRQAIALQQELVDDFPAEPVYRKELAGSHNNLGILLQTTGRLQEAEAVHEQTLALRERLAADFPDVAAYRLDVAGSHNNLGALWQDTGQLQKAETAYRHALALRERLVADFPTVATYRQDLANNHLNLGNLLKATGRFEKADAAYRQAVKLQQELVTAFPTEPPYRFDLARSHDSQGLLLQAKGDLREAEYALRRALALHEKLAADFPTVPEYRQALARSHVNLSCLLLDTDRRPEVEAACRRAAALQEQLVADFPGALDFRRDLGVSYHNLGMVLQQAGQRQPAETAYRQALDLRERLIADLPGIPDYQSELATTLNNLGRLLLDEGQPKEARALLERAIGYQRTALKSNPHHPGYSLSLSHNYRSLAATLLALGEHDGAAGAARELARIFPDQFVAAYDAACYLAQCVPLAENDARLSERDRKPLAQQYGDQAIELLRAAIRNGFRDAAHLDQDADFYPLRARADFREVVKKLKDQGQGSGR